MSITYRDMKNLFEKELSFFRSTLNDLKHSKRQYESEAFALSDSVGMQKSKLVSAIAQTVRDNGNKLSYVEHIKEKLGISFDVGLKHIENAVFEIEQLVGKQQELDHEYLKSKNELSKFESIKENKSKIYEENKENAIVFNELYELINDIRDFVIENELQIEKSKNVGVFSNVFNTRIAQIGRKMRVLEKYIKQKDIKEFDQIDVYDNFEEAYDITKKTHYELRDIEIQSKNAYSSYSKFKDEFQEQSRHNARHQQKIDMAKSDFQKHTLSELVGLLSSVQLDNMLKEYGIPTVSEARTDNDIRKNFLKKILRNIQDDINSVESVISKLNYPMSKLNKAARRSPHKRNHKFDNNDFERSMKLFKNQKSKSLNWYQNTYQNYNSTHQTTSFDCMDALLLAFVIDGLSDDNNLGAMLFSEELNDFSIDNIDLDSLDMNNLDIDVGQIDVSSLSNFDIPDIEVPRMDVPNIDIPTVDTSSGFDSGSWD